METNNSDKWTRSAQEAWQAVLTGVKRLKSEGKTLEEIATIIGVGNRSLIGEWLKGNREAINAPFPNMLRYLDRLGYNPSDFLPSEEALLPTIHRLRAHSPVDTVDGDSLPTIPVVAAAGAGNPVEFFDTSAVARRIPVLPEYAVKNVVAVQVTGDSMEPIIRKGAYVGVVPLMGGELAEGGVYLVSRPPFGLVVKRIRMSANGKIILHSDNQKYEPVEIDIEGYEQIIVGEVVWCWQAMK